MQNKSVLKLGDEAIMGGLDVGDGLMNVAENGIGVVADNMEDFAMGVMTAIGPEAFTKEIKKKYFGSFLREVLPIFAFVVYYYYY